MIAIPFRHFRVITPLPPGLARLRVADQSRNLDPWGIVEHLTEIHGIIGKALHLRKSKSV